MVSQHPQRLWHASARLGHLDHVEKHRAEGLRLLRKGLFKGRAALDGDLDTSQNRSERCSRELLFQARERPNEVDARAQIRSKLPAELGELAGTDAAEKDAFPQIRA